MKAFRSHEIELRGMRHHVLTWGDSQAPKLYLVHGWMDVAASFQFLVDALQGEWHVIAPDLRGYGRSEWQPQGYWIADYIADLDALIRHFSPDAPADLVGHSLGGNVVMQYAGAKPSRVRRVVSLEGFGIPAELPERAPKKLARWLDAIASPEEFRPYANIGAVADRLQKTNPRLPRDKATFLAAHWARVLPDGRAQLVSDPRHKLPFPIVYRMEEIVAIWKCITAPVLWVAASDSNIPKWLNDHPEGEGGTDALDGVRRRLAQVPQARLAVVDDASHMLHHDQPEAVAALIEAFLAS